MEKISLSKKAFNLLIASLVELEENQADILDYYFPVPDKTREDMDSMIKNYIDRMNATLQRVSVVDSPEFDKFPFVVIGSNIVVQEMESKSNHEFRLIAPSAATVNEGDVSIFSPIGQALLLQENNSIVEYDAPGGKFCCKILSTSIRAFD